MTQRQETYYGALPVTRQILLAIYGTKEAYFAATDPLLDPNRLLDEACRGYDCSFQVPAAARYALQLLDPSYDFQGPSLRNIDPDSIREELLDRLIQLVDQPLLIRQYLQPTTGLGT